MLEMIFNITTNIIRFVYMYISIQICKKVDINWKSMLLHIIVYNIGYVILRDNDYKMYLLQYLYTFIYLYILGRRTNIEKDILVSLISAILISYEIINMATNFVGAIFIAFLPIFSRIIQSVIVFCLVILKSIIIYYVLRIFNKNNKKVLKILKGNYLVSGIYFITVFIRVPFLYTDLRDGLMLKVVFGCIICCAAIFYIILQNDKRNAAKEKARIEENNKLLSAKLHKSQEILPAMVQVLSDVTEKNGAEMEEHKAHKLLKEVSNLYCQQMKENEKEDLQLKNFCSTGLTLLDQQLKVYQSEAIEREYNLDIYVQAPINDLIKNTNIDQLRLQRAIGDLIRNAFCAVGKTDKKGGHILLIIGCQKDNILEVAVMDDGIEMPLQVLEAFGKRGITTGGTGNGLADIWEFAKETKASIQVDEFREEDSFTKKISIIFNGQQIYCLNSSRKDDVKSFKWNN